MSGIKYRIQQALKKIENNGQLNMEELIIFLRQNIRDINMSFKQAKVIQDWIQSIRLQYCNVVDGDGNAQRLSKIEEIYFYGYQHFNLSRYVRDTDPKRNDILDQDLKNDTLNRLIEDVQYYIPLIPAENRLFVTTLFVIVVVQ